MSKSAIKRVSNWWVAAWSAWADESPRPMLVRKIVRDAGPPTQFFGDTYDGYQFHGHYRHGALCVEINGIRALTMDDGSGSSQMEIEDFLRICRQHDLFLEKKNDQTA